MTRLVASAGAAMRWKAMQLLGMQLAYIVRLLILAKLLAPDAFGLLAIATVALGMMLRLSETGTFAALVHQREPTLDQYDAAWTVGLVRAAAGGLLLVASAPWIASMFNEVRAVPVIQVLALRPLIDAAGSIGKVSLIRELKFREVAFIHVPGAAVDLVVSVATAPWLGVWALVLGALAGSLANTILSYALAPHRPRLSFAWGSIRGFAGYGQWVFLTGVVGLAGSLALQMMISRTLGAAALGLYFLASKAASVPVDAVRSIVGAVAFPMFVRLRDDAAALGRTFSTLLAGLYLAALPAFALVYVLAPELEHALGAHWAGTAPMMQILSIAGAVALLGQMFVPLLLGLGMPERVLGIEIVQTVVLLVVLVPALQAFEVNGAALSWLAGNAAALALVATWTAEANPWRG